MDGNNARSAEGSAPWTLFAWATAFAGLLAWQAYLTLRLFGATVSLEPLLDERPVLSGFHPQHQYLGHLGARALRQQGEFCVYDPAFQAGYPKTPVFNSSRLAELFLFLGGDEFRPQAYKIGLAIICLLIPVFLMLAGTAMGLGFPAAWLATLTGLTLWWGPQGRQALEIGDLEVLLASLSVLAHMGLLIRFHDAPGFLVWLGLAVTGALGWFLQPMLFPIALPLLLAYYLFVGIRHASLTWHLALAGAEVIGLGVNLPWLMDWFLFWWMRSPLPLGEDMLRHRTFQTLWEARLWGGPIERGLAFALILSGFAGCLILHRTQRRPAARVLALGGGGFLTLALLGVSWEPLGRFGTAGLLLPGLWFASLPAAFFWVWGVVQMRKAGAVGNVMLAGLAVFLAVVCFLDSDIVEAAGERFAPAPPLVLGLSSEREELLGRIRSQTTKTARILWEDRSQSRQASRWPALLPLWVDRSFVGGIDGDGLIEHSSIGLHDGKLAGKPLASWSPAELDEYCRRYNIGWIVCWTTQTAEALNRWDAAQKIAAVSDQGEGWLYEIKTCPRSFTLKGRADILQADSRHITLANLEPDQGVVVLSLHYQTGMRASPSRVQVERETCGRDPVGFVRLRVAGPVARMTLTWER